MQFVEIEKICGEKLFDSAYLYAQCWNNGAHNSFSKSWYNAGYNAHADLQSQSVVFVKKSIDSLQTQYQSMSKSFCKPSVHQPKQQICTLDIRSALTAVQKYYQTTNKENHTRYLSWEHCRKAFAVNWCDSSKTEYLCLHLAWYLASWGMLRNSFLFQNDYLIHKNVVINLCSADYQELFESNAPNVELVMKAAKVIHEGYGENKVSDTLVTKILLGVYGCAPAYDRYFKETAKKNGISPSFNADSLTALWNYYYSNKDTINDTCIEIGLPLDLYTPMKLMDMCFWQIGYDMDKEKSKNDTIITVLFLK